MPLFNYWSSLIKQDETLKGGRKMGWLIIVAVAYLPIIISIRRRLDNLEKEVKRLKGEKDY